MPLFMPKGVLSDDYINKKCAVHKAVPLNRIDLMTITNEGQLIRPSNYAYFLNNSIPNDGLKEQVTKAYQTAIEKAPAMNIVKASLNTYTPDKPGKTTAGYAEEQRQKIIKLQEDKLNQLINQANTREQALQGHINQLQSQINAINAQMTVATQSINTLIQSAPASAQQNVALQQQLAQLQADLAQSQADLTQEQQNITALTNQLTTLTTDNQQLTQKNTQLTQDNTQLTQDIALIQQQLSNTTNLSQQQIAQLQAELQKKTNELQQAQLQAQQLNTYNVEYLKLKLPEQSKILNDVKGAILRHYTNKKERDRINKTVLKNMIKLNTETLRYDSLQALLQYAKDNNITGIDAYFEQEMNQYLQGASSSSSSSQLPTRPTTPPPPNTPPTAQVTPTQP